MSVDPVASAVEICLRCGAGMEWRHATFQCPRCRFKIGCCEGNTGDCGSEVDRSFLTAPSSSNSSTSVSP